jgi:hypothetical protein
VIWIQFQIQIHSQQVGAEISLGMASFGHHASNGMLLDARLE